MLYKSKIIILSLLSISLVFSAKTSLAQDSTKKSVKPGKRIDSAAVLRNRTISSTSIGAAPMGQYTMGRYNTMSGSMSGAGAALGAAMFIGSQFSKQSIMLKRQDEMHVNFIMAKGNIITYDSAKPQNFAVMMKDSSVLLCSNSFIYADAHKRRNYLVFTDKNFKESDTTHRYQKIYPEQTIGIWYGLSSVNKKSLENLSDGQLWYKGLVKDSCWMFKSVDGPISLYTYCIPWNESTVIGMQTGNDPIETFNATNLKKKMWRNPDAMESLFGYEYLVAVNRYNKETLKAAKKKAKDAEKENKN